MNTAGVSHQHDGDLLLGKAPDVRVLSGTFDPSERKVDEIGGRIVA
jgi:hypothetical protein